MSRGRKNLSPQPIVEIDNNNLRFFTETMNTEDDNNENNNQENRKNKGKKRARDDPEENDNPNKRRETEPEGSRSNVDNDVPPNLYNNLTLYRERVNVLEFTFDPMLCTSRNFFNVNNYKIESNLPFPIKFDKYLRDRYYREKDN